MKDTWTIAERVRHFASAVAVLRRGGGTLRGTILWPLRRRLPSARNQIDLKIGVTLVSPPEEPLLGLFTEIWLDHCYTPPGFEIARGDTIVDIGANVGVFTVWAATREASVRVFSVEPSPSTCECLRQNAARNHLENVSILQAACGGASGTVTLQGRGHQAENSIYTRDVAGREFHPIAAVAMVPLAELFARFEIQTCDLLKMDCEGAEYEILYGADAETLRRIRRIVMEYHVGLNEHTPEELAEFLERRGFRVDYTPLLDEEGGYLYAHRV